MIHHRYFSNINQLNEFNSKNKINIISIETVNHRNVWNNELSLYVDYSIKLWYNTIKDKI